MAPFVELRASGADPTRPPNTYEAPGCQGAQPSVDEKTFALVTASLSEVTAL